MLSRRRRWTHRRGDGGRGVYGDDDACCASIRDVGWGVKLRCVTVKEEVSAHVSSGGLPPPPPRCNRDHSLPFAFQAQEPKPFCFYPRS